MNRRLRSSEGRGLRSNLRRMRSKIWFFFDFRGLFFFCTSSHSKKKIEIK